jgi:N-acetylmuramoyl-L-alanine amidase
VAGRMAGKTGVMKNPIFRNRPTLFLLLSLALQMASPLLHADILDMRIWQYPDKTKLVFDLSGPVEHKVFTLSGPDRVVIDFSNVKNRINTASVKLEGTAVSAIRTGVPEHNITRVVLDVNETLSPSSEFIPPNDKYPNYRLSIDLKRMGTTQSVSPVKKVAPPQNKARTLIVAIDAGHGGEDPGATGARKNREKTVVLAIARELQAMLQKDPAFTPFMVRTGDYYVGLRERSDKARAANADLFVSIHADAFKNPAAHGASVYVLSDRGATSETARWLADTENAADLIGGVSLDDKEDHVRMTLLDLSMTYQRNASMGVASSILGHMGSFARLHKKSVEQAAFVVLKSPDMPALLVETGFISNPEEEAKLITAAYQRKMAGAILAGIKEYFSKHPPTSAPQPVLRQATQEELPEPVVLLASNSATAAPSAATGQQAGSVVPADMVARPPLNPVTLPKPASSQAAVAKTAATKTDSAATPQKATVMTYVIRRGDTLSEIASENGVAIAELRRVNGLRSDQIRIGQTLKIPKS